MSNLVSLFSFLCTEINVDFNKVNFIKENIMLTIVLFWFLLVFSALISPLSYLMGMVETQTFMMIIFSFILVAAQIFRLQTMTSSVHSLVVNHTNEIMIIAFIVTILMMFFFLFSECLYRK